MAVAAVTWTRSRKSSILGLVRHFDGFPVNQARKKAAVCCELDRMRSRFGYYCVAMWANLLRTRAERLPVWAALCTGRADGSNFQYPAHEKHSILAMVRAPEAEVNGRIHALLKSTGWFEPEIKSLKVLDQPFHS